jgi:hypothetical protein
VKRIAYLATAALLALLIVTPAAFGQDNNMMMSESTMMDQNMMEQPKMMDQGSMEQPKMMQMPNTGGPSLGLWLLPAAALLVGTGLMGGYVVRQRRR